LLSDRLAGQISPESAADLEAHLVACTACATLEKDWVRQELEIFHKAAREEERELVATMRATLAGAPAAGKRPPARGLRVLSWGLAAAAVLVGLLVFLLSHSGIAPVAPTELKPGDSSPGAEFVRRMTPNRWFSAPNTHLRQVVPDVGRYPRIR